MNVKTGATLVTKPPRDLRLDFFRGIAMFIILLAHTPGNTWTLWIPARFGFSDATEIFVFCSGMASALAFGVVFAKKSWFLGAARICFRVWQVYWAHIGVFITTALLMVAIDQTGLGEEGKTYADWFSVTRFFSHTQDTLLGLMTLSYVPGLFDILPMYLVILAMVPVVMLAHRFGGRWAVFGLVGAMWLAAQLALWHRSVGTEETHLLGAVLASIGSMFSILNLPASPWNPTNVWFFNPFGWQLVFFTGFAFGMKWIPAPPVNRTLILIAAGYVILTLPLAWFKIHRAVYLPDEWLLHDWIFYAREWIEPLRWKTGVGLMRYVHFLAIGYLAWAAVGPSGIRLYEGWSVPRVAKPVTLVIMGVIAFVTIPYAYVEEIRMVSPAANQLIFDLYQPLGLILPEERIGMAQIAHMIAMIILAWAAIGAVWRKWLVTKGFLSLVPIIRKVGTQSLAVFMMSIVLSRFNGWWLDVIGRDVWDKALVNLTGIGILIGTAYLVGWLKAEPWRKEVKPQVTENAQTSVASRSPAE
ncbi:MAG: OpgC domain-containing protein [Pseudomonadota bacterium]